MTITDSSTDGRRIRGDRSRDAVLHVAVNAASIGGLEGLSIGGLAADSGLSKSGVVALFGTKEQLQLATVAAAREIFIAEVVRPSLEVEGGLNRLNALIDNWIEYSKTRVFAGGCFFAAAQVELGSQPGPVRDAVSQANEEWLATVQRITQRAIDRGELRDDADAAQLAFEITAQLDAANSRSLLNDSDQPYLFAKRATLRALSSRG